MVVRLPVEVVEEIISLHRDGFTISQITTVTGRNYRTVRRHIDPEFRRTESDTNAQRWRKRREQQRRAAPRRFVAAGLHRSQLDAARSAVPTLEMLEQAYRRAIAPRTITAAICGDPPPGFSALDQRHG